MPIFLLASFPNSRNRNRNATIDSNSSIVTLPINTSAPVRIAIADPNRTSLVLTNTSTTTTMYYATAFEGIINPTVVATAGLPGDMYVRTSTNDFYIKQDTGTTTNWLLVAPPYATGFFPYAAQLLPNQSVCVDALQAVYGQSASGAVTVDVQVVNGRG